MVRATSLAGSPRGRDKLTRKVASGLFVGYAEMLRVAERGDSAIIGPAAAAGRAAAATRSPAMGGGEGWVTNTYSLCASA
jgi:hypothetical protein